MKQCYFGQLPFYLMHKLIKWEFLTSLSSVPARFHVLYELNRHKVDSYILKYGHTKCCKSVIDNYFVDCIPNRQKSIFAVSCYIRICVWQVYVSSFLFLLIISAYCSE